MGAAGQTGHPGAEKGGEGGWRRRGFGQLEATRAPAGRCLFCTFDQTEPPLAAKTPFSGLFAVTWHHLGPNTTAM